MFLASPRSSSRPPPTAIRFLIAVLLVVSSCTLPAQDFDALSADLQAGRYGPVNSLLVEHRGRLVYERYFRGTDADDLQLLNSVTKSVGATLVGMAHRRGLLAVSDRIDGLLPQYDWNAAPYAQHRELELEHVLTMRHGMAWDEWTHGFTDPRNSAVQMFASSDWYGYTLSRARVDAPDTRFTYSSGNSTLMSGVLRHVTGKPPQALFAEWLATPLGIERFDWELWHPDGPGRGLRQFPFGDAPLGVGLWLLPRDLIKIGRLYLSGGMHEGTRLLDREWIDASWTPHNHAGNDAYFAASSERAGYGYQWWFRELLDSAGRRHACWFANGAGHQYLFVCPDVELVVASTGESYAYSGPGILNVLRETLLPSLRFPVSSRLSGFYYDPASSGQGITFDVIDDGRQVIAGWYTFAQGQQRWYAMHGLVEDDRVDFAQILRVEGGDFLGSAPTTTTSVGSATLEWSSCTEARLDFDFELGAGAYRLLRLPATCE